MIVIDLMRARMLFRKPQMTSLIHILCHLSIILHQIQNLPTSVSSQQQYPEASVKNCLAAPCQYRGECRDRSGLCGDTVVHCNEESLWVPSCGGGGTSEHPSDTDTAPSPAVVYNIPVSNEQTTIIEVERPTPASASASSGGGSLRSEPTPSPITKWEEWLSEKNNQPTDNNGNNIDWAANGSGNTNNGSGNQPQQTEQGKGVPGLTTGKEGENPDWEKGNETSWIKPESWGSRQEGEEEEEGILDKMKFWENSAMMSVAKGSDFVLLVTAVVASWAILL